MVLSLIKTFIRLYFWKKFTFFTFSLHAVPDAPSPHPLSPLVGWPQSWHAPEIDLLMLVIALFSQSGFVAEFESNAVFLSFLSVLAAEQGSLAVWHNSAVHLSHLESVQVNV